jgi:hypothetical protein
MDDMEILSGLKDTLVLVSDRSHQLLRGRHGEATVRANAPDYPGTKPGTVLDPLGSAAVDAANKTFLDTVAASAGSQVHVINYTDLSVAANLPSCTGYPLFIAYYSGSAPASVSPWKSWAFWQYAGGGGPTGADQDAYNGDVAALQKWVDSIKNGPTPTPTPAPSSNWTETMISELPTLSENASQKTADEDVKSMQALLTARGHAVSTDGFFGPGTKTAVEAFQRSSGLSVDGVVGQDTWTKLLNR